MQTYVTQTTEDGDLTSFSSEDQKRIMRVLNRTPGFPGVTAVAAENLTSLLEFIALMQEEMNRLYGEKAAMTTAALKTQRDIQGLRRVFGIEK